MTRLILLLLLLFSANVVDCQSKSTEEVFDQGNRFFASGNYSKSIAAFEALHNSGIKSPELYCNLGNAWFKAGGYGKAMLFYQKGLLMSPFDTELIHNRDLLNAKLDIPPGSYNKLDIVDDEALIRSADIAGIAATTVFFICSVLFILSIAQVKQYRVKQIYTRLFAFSLTVLFLSFCFFRYITSGTNAVANKSIITKTGPGQLAKDAFVLPEGEMVAVINNYDGWYKIKKYDGQLAWLPVAYLSLIKP